MDWRTPLLFGFSLIWGSATFAADPVFKPLSTRPSLSDIESDWLRVNSEWNKHCRENKRTWVNWTADEDRRYAEIIARRILIDFWSDYQLTGDQGRAVQQVLAAFVENQCAYLTRVRPALQDPSREMKAAQERLKRKEPVSRSAVASSRQQLLSFAKDMPSSHRRTIEAQAEALLPPEQVTEGRKRALERRRKRVMPVINNVMSERIREDTDWRPALDDLSQAGQWPLGDWEAYVEMFIRCYKLLPDQQSGARSALREALQVRRTVEVRYKSTSAGPATQPVNQQEERFQAISSVFEDLKRGLEVLPTHTQRLQARPGIATSQSQPS